MKFTHQFRIFRDLKLLQLHNQVLPAAVLLATLAMTMGSIAVAQRPKPLPPGMFSTRGNQLVDRDNSPIRLSCVYWQGLNGEDGTLDDVTGPIVGLQANVNAIAETGFNCIRVDFNNISLHDSTTSAFLQRLDQVVAAAGRAQLRIVIDDHDNEGNYGTNDSYSADCAAQQQNGIWYDLGGASDGTDGCNDPGHTTQASFENDWVFIAARYARNNTVIGYDLWNEPLSYGFSTWGDGTDRDIHLMYQTVGSAILSRDPSKLIFAECPQEYSGPLFDGTTGDAPWGDCTGVKNTPVVFTLYGQAVRNKVVYDVHLYPNSVSDVAHLFGGSSSSPSAIQAMNYSFGYLESQNMAPVWDGETGTGLAQNPDDQDWAIMLDNYLDGRLGSQGGPTFSCDRQVSGNWRDGCNLQGMGIAWETWATAQSQDNLGILNPDGSRVAAQLNIIDPLLYYPRWSRLQHTPNEAAPQ